MNFGHFAAVLSEDLLQLGQHDTSVGDLFDNILRCTALLRLVSTQGRYQFPEFSLCHMESLYGPVFKYRLFAYFVFAIHNQSFNLTRKRPVVVMAQAVAAPVKSVLS
jgi:hypothetical protein